MAPQIKDVEGELSNRLIGGHGRGVSQGPATARLRETLDMAGGQASAQATARSVGDEHVKSRGARAAVGYQGHTPRLGHEDEPATEPPPVSLRVERSGAGLEKPRPPRVGETDGSVATGPLSARWYVPSLAIAEVEKERAREERMQIPGYTGTVRGARNKFANTFGDITRHQLTKSEAQNPGHQPPPVRLIKKKKL
jgi:hypothetical protein